MNEKLKDIELFLFDMDGTVYRGDTVFPFTAETLAQLRKNGKRYMFLTNNARNSVPDYIKKLDRMGIKADENDFVTSSTATAYYIKENFGGANAYVCGTQSFKDELTSFGICVTEDEEKADTVIMSSDTSLTYDRLEKVCRLLFTKKINYLATNPDMVLPMEYGFSPDCGSLCEIIYISTRKQPKYIGKPSSLMAELAMKKAGVRPEKTAVVGDLITTDIQCGINAGCTTVLVLSGATTHEAAAVSNVKPDIILPDISYIVK